MRFVCGTIECGGSSWFRAELSVAIPPLHVSFVGFVSFCLCSNLGVASNQGGWRTGDFLPNYAQKQAREFSHIHTPSLMSQ